MIKPEDIRLNNFIKSNIEGCNKMGSGIIQLDSTALAYLYEVDNDWERLEGIPLSQEWLERLGLGKLDNALDWSKYRHLKLSGLQVTFIGNKAVFHCGVAKLYTRELFYVHSLQNFYKEITGKELELKQ